MKLKLKKKKIKKLKLNKIKIHFINSTKFYFYRYIDKKR